MLNLLEGSFRSHTMRPHRLFDMRALCEPGYKKKLTIVSA